MKKWDFSILLTAALLLLLPIQMAYVQGYKIEAEISGMNDTTLILSYRYGNKFFSVDTVLFDSKGYAMFSGTTELERGMYQLVLPDKNFVDFFIDDSQNIMIRTKSGSLIESLHSPNSFPNEEYFKWQAGNHRLRIKAEQLQAEMDKAAGQTGQSTELQNELNRLRESNQVLWDNAINKLEGFLPGKFLKGIRPFVVPDEKVKGPDGNIDQQAQYEYYKNHYFDNVDFTDPALIRTPLVYSKLDQFFSRVVPPNPDSVNHYADKLIKLSEGEPEMFRFVLQWLLNYYSDPKIMGLDASYVYLAEKYYLSGRAVWVDQENLEDISSRVKTLKPLLIGQPAPELPGLETPDGEVIDIKDIKAKYTVLYFWEPDCSFCKKSTPELNKVYERYQHLGVELVAVNTRHDNESWKKFIADNELTCINVFAPHTIRDVLANYEAYSTPKILILDSDKKIVAKDITVEQTSQMLEYLLTGN